MDLQKALDALTEDLDPADKAKVQMFVLSAVGAFQKATKGRDVERLRDLMLASVGMELADRWIFRRLMVRAGYGEYAGLLRPAALAVEIFGRRFERGRATTRHLRAELEAAGSSLGVPPRKEKAPPPS